MLAAFLATGSPEAYLLYNEAKKNGERKSMYLQVQALVLRVTDYNDRDALLTLLTRRHGKLTVKARGLRRKNSP